VPAKGEDDMAAKACPGRKPTEPIARSAGWDAGNRSMKKAGRKKWSKKDYNVAVHEYMRLVACMEK